MSDLVIVNKDAGMKSAIGGISPDNQHKQLKL